MDSKLACKIHWFYVVKFILIFSLISSCTEVSVQLTESLKHPDLAYSKSIFRIPVGNAINIIPVLFTNDKKIKCSITPSLPPELVLDLNTCAISGTPTAVSTLTAYKITATSVFKISTVINISIEVHIACPVNYVRIPHNNAFDTSTDFCVSKYEMKNVNGEAVSQASGFPWVSQNQTNSINLCKNLGSHYDLISNQEWMTIARNIELVDSNWSSNIAGVDVLARGHSDTGPAHSLEASENDRDGYFNTNNNEQEEGNSGWEQKRTHTLSTGDVIWDLAGNVYEWVNWNITPAKKAFASAVGFPNGTFQQWRDVNMLVGENIDDQMLPKTWASSFFSSLDTSNGLGAYYAGLNSNGGAAVRGGFWSNTHNAGIFTLATHLSSASVSSQLGFRCVYRP